MREGDDLAVALEDLGAHLRAPDVDLVDRVVAAIDDAVPAHQLVPRRLAPRRAVPRWALVAGVAVGVAFLAVLAVAPARQAVARWFGIGVVQLRSQGELPASIGSELRLGRPVALDEIGAVVSFEVLAPTALGPPAAAFGGLPSDDAVSLVWAAGDRFAAAGDTGVAVLLSQYGGTTDKPLVEKHLAPDTRVELVQVGGADGFWITGAPHAFTYLDADGHGRPDTTRLGGNTLLWVEGGVTYRLESGLELAGALALAEGLEPIS
jgi:hypothetical protein